MGVFAYHFAIGKADLFLGVFEKKSQKEKEKGKKSPKNFEEIFRVQLCIGSRQFVFGGFWRCLVILGFLAFFLAGFLGVFGRAKPVFEENRAAQSTGFAWRFLGVFGIFGAKKFRPEISFADLSTFMFFGGFWQVEILRLAGFWGFW